MVIGLARGEVTLMDLVGFFKELVDGNMLHYRKIVDVTGATPAITQEEVATFTERVRNQPRPKAGGAVAFVAEARRGEFVRLFSQLMGGDRPIEVFSSIHAARKWLYANTTIAP